MVITYYFETLKWFQGFATWFFEHPCSKLKVKKRASQYLVTDSVHFSDSTHFSSLFWSTTTSPTGMGGFGKATMARTQTRSSSLLSLASQQYLKLWPVHGHPRTMVGPEPLQVLFSVHSFDRVLQCVINGLESGDTDITFIFDLQGLWFMECVKERGERKEGTEMQREEKGGEKKCE